MKTRAYLCDFLEFLQGFAETGKIENLRMQHHIVGTVRRGRLPSASLMNNTRIRSPYPIVVEYFKTSSQMKCTSPRNDEHSDQPRNRCVHKAYR